MKRDLVYKFIAPWGLVLLAAVLRAGDTAIVNGQNAEDVIGQSTSGSPDFNSGTPYDSQVLYGFNQPFGVDIDTTSHRLFVADTLGHRIVVYDLNSSNVIVDRTPDHVLGQAGFYTNVNTVAVNRLNWPIGVDFDPYTNRLFVADQGNSRVVVFDVGSITDGENAVNVLGQSNFTSQTAATSVNGLRNVYYVVCDTSNRLFVSDTNNNRIMVFDVASITDGENAVNVLGQSDFTSGSSAVAANRLNGVRQAAIDSVNGRLFAADLNNQRVVVFDVNAISDGENAVNVIGQSNFTSSGTGLTQNRMTNPYGITFSQATQRLFVSESGNHRTMVFDVASISDGENAVNVLGQSTYTSSTARTTQDGLNSPLGLTLDDRSNRLYVAEYRNFRVVEFDVSTTTITNGQNAENLVGQTDGSGNAVYTTGYIYDGVGTSGYIYPYGVELDTSTHRLFVSDYYSCRVLVYNLDTSNTLTDRTLDNVLGQPDFFAAQPLSTQSGLYFPFGIDYDGGQNRLFVADYGNNRVVVYDVATITNGENAVNVLGKNNFTSTSGGTTRSVLYGPTNCAYQPNSSLLFVSDYINHRVMVFDVGSITDGENAVNVLGQNDFTTATYATTQNGMYYPHWVELDSNQKLFVSDMFNHRVLVFDVSSITDGENAINVLGQTTFTTRTAATTQSGMNNPRALAIDNGGNRLFVSESSNARVTVFDVASITDGENALNVLGKSTFNSASSATNQTGLTNPRGVAYDSGMNRLYIADYGNNRVITHSVGPVSPSTSTLAATGGGDQISLSWASAGDDGAFNNLTGNYRIQFATYTASWSTSTTPTDATTITIATTSATPGSAQSRVISGLTIGTTYYFVLWSADEVPNWSGISNTTSAVPTAWFDSNQIEVDGAGGGLTSFGLAWGDFDNDGDMDVLASGSTIGSTRELRIYKNNGNATMDAAQIEVAGAGAGLDGGSTAWGDYDNDGDIDVLAIGSTSSTKELRIYKNNGNGTIDATPIEVDGPGGGLSSSNVAWGDYDNDGDLDILTNGYRLASELRIYKNNGNGTVDATQIEVDGPGGGTSSMNEVWGDYDNDGDLDIVGSGSEKLRIYKNNGNGTVDPVQIEVDGPSGMVALGDYDDDGDLDILANGNTGGRHD